MPADREILAIEFQELIKLDADLSITGFSTAEVNIQLDEADDGSTATASREDIVLDHVQLTFTRPGDLWKLGRHRLLCGDARAEHDDRLLLGGEVADLVFTDPPYNVPVDRYVSGPQRA